MITSRNRPDVDQIVTFQIPTEPPQDSNNGPHPAIGLEEPR
jgi:hypothetical protein